jgi:hypothetical protein
MICQWVILLKLFYKNKIKFGVSSRALGSVKESKGNIVVQDDLQLICFDIVSDPSNSWGVFA